MQRPVHPLAACFAVASVALISARNDAIAADSKAPERTVEDSTVTSRTDPSAQIRLPSAARYIGADRWVLYEISDCELHLFIEPGEEGNVLRLYWVQFEGYLPTKPDLQHVYDSPRHTSIGGLDFYVDEVSPDSRASDPKSDVGHVEGLLKKSGYRTPTRMKYLRLVHLLDTRKRKELMIIYGEDVAAPGALKGGLLERAKDRIRIDTTAHGR